MCIINNVKLAFDEREIFYDVNYNRLIGIIDKWIVIKSNNHSLELFAELRRIWKFGSPLFANGCNVAATIQGDYVFSRVQKPMPTRLFTDIESIAHLWFNSAKCMSVHQKNALRYMILTGVRPINIGNFRLEFIEAVKTTNGHVEYDVNKMDTITYPEVWWTWGGQWKLKKSLLSLCQKQWKVFL